MNRKKWICTAAAITGLLLAVIVGLSVRHMKNGSYVSASDLAGQKRAEASKDQENVSATEKCEDMDKIWMKQQLKMKRKALWMSQKLTVRKVNLIQRKLVSR